MKPNHAALQELGFAVLLLVASTAGALWVRHDASVVDAMTETRRWQLVHLGRLEREGRGNAPAAGQDLDCFADLFLGHAVAWAATPPCAFLTLRRLPTEHR